MGLGVPRVPLAVPGLDLVAQWGLHRDPAPKALTTSRAAVERRPVAPTARLGGIMALSCVGDALGLRGGKGVRPRGGGVGRPRVQPAADGLAMRRRRLPQGWAHVRPLHGRSLRRPGGQPGARARGKSHAKVCRPLALLCRVRAARRPRLGWERRPDGPAPLGRHGLSAHVGPLGSRRVWRASAAVLPVADTSGRWLRRPTPGWLVPRWPGRLVQGRRRGSWDTEATLSHATMVSARLRQVQRACPAGAWRPDQARPGAAAAPVMLRRCAVGTGVRDTAAAHPASTQRVVSGATFFVDPAYAAALAAWGPPQVRSAWSPTSACSIVRRLALVFAIIARQATRAVSVKATASLMAITSPSC